MVAILICKLASSAIGVLLAVHSASPPMWVAAVLGILPIWFEVAASRALDIEPGFESRKVFRALDALVDAVVFVLVPAFWYLTVTARDWPVWTAVLGFVFCGIFRLIRFALQGLSADGQFEGLPVTYTGYLWPLIVALERISIWLPIPMILLASAAMVSHRIRISPSLQPRKQGGST